MTVFISLALSLGAALLGAPIGNGGLDLRPAATRHAAGYRVEVEIESVVTRPYAGFEFRMLSVGSAEAPRRADLSPVRARGTLRFKGTDEELAALGFKGSDEELQALRGARAILQGDCADLRGRAVDVRVRLRSGREWTTATATYERIDVLLAACDGLSPRTAPSPTP